MMVTTIGTKFVQDLMMIYDAEHRFLEAQQKMLQKATNAQVRLALTEHIAQTSEQIANLAQVFALLGTTPASEPSDAASGLVMQGETAMQATQENPMLLDCAIVEAAAAVEHYEIAAYRSLIAMAEQFNQPGLLQMLHMNLEQEERTAEKVEGIAKELIAFAGTTQRVRGGSDVEQIVIG
jgi:ferritin-like metal-binding protein YciE